MKSLGDAPILNFSFLISLGTSVTGDSSSFKACSFDGDRHSGGDCARADNDEDVFLLKLNPTSLADGEKGSSISVSSDRVSGSIP